MQPLSQESIIDIYTIYYETHTSPVTWPMDGLRTSIHYMMYLPQRDITEIIELASNNE